MDIATFLDTSTTAGREAGLALTPENPGAPAFRFTIGPFPARMRIGFDPSPGAGMTPDAVLEIMIGRVHDRWPAMAAWSLAPELAMAEHRLPHPLPRPDLALGSGSAVAVQILYRARLSTFDVATALVLLHVGTAYAAFMARELMPHMEPDAAVVLAAHGLARGAVVPMPEQILSARGAVLCGAA